MTVATLRVTETGGRAATTRHIPPKLALAVGMPSTKAPEGWRWTALTNLARLESGHTPSRRHPEYWGGDIPWISLADAKRHHGGRIEQTIETTNALGIENSSARVLPQNTVCLSRTASVGYVLIMGRPMATSQDFVNWICSEHLDPRFLQYLFIAEGENLTRFASGAVHNTIYFPEVKAFHICHPPLIEQQRIAGVLDEAFEDIATSQANAERNLENARAVFESELNAIFSQGGNQWCVKEISEIAQSSLGKMLDKTKNRGDLKPYLRNLNVRWFDFDLTDVQKMRFLPEEAKKYTVNKGDVLICEGGYPGRAAVWEKEESIYFQKALHRVRFRELAYAKWLVYYLYNQDRNGMLKRHFTGAGIQHFTGEALSRFQLPVPPLSDVRAIVAKLEKLRTETRRLEWIYLKKVMALDALKKSLLHEAFSGNL